MAALGLLISALLSVLGARSAPARSANQAGPTPPRVTATSVPGPTGCPFPVSTWPLAERVNQLLMVGGQFSDLQASAPEAGAGVGGLVLFGQPAAGSAPAIRSGISGLDAAATGAGRVVPWMSTDEEGGPIARLAKVIGPLPSPRQMAEQWTPAQVTSALQQHGAAMRSLGITMDLAPVLDTASPNDTVAGENYRSFSDNPRIVSAFAVAYATGLERAGVVPVAKHFPGLGHANADTDTSPASTPPLPQLEADDLIPFNAVISAGVPALMVGHMSVPGLTGGKPASLSPEAYAMLRGTYHFSGVAITDDLGAVAISAAGYSEAQAAVAAIGAGADMAMIDAPAYGSTVNALTAAVDNGSLPVSTINAAVGRVLAAKGLERCAQSAIIAERARRRLIDPGPPWRRIPGSAGPR